MSTEKKAGEYLVSGRIKTVAVDEESGTFHASSSSSAGVYVIRYTGVWSCTCPARIERCAHIQACQKITDFQESGGRISLGRDADIDALLADFNSPSEDLRGYDPYENHQ